MTKCIVCKRERPNGWGKYCSMKCSNRATKTTPISGWKNCVNCAKAFPYKESAKVRGSWSVELNMMVGSVKQRFCSKQCSLKYRNKHNNPAQTERGRKKISEKAKLRSTDHLRTKEAREKLKKTISGSGHWNWQGGLSKPKCVDCTKTISHGKKRCKKCNGIHIRGENAPNWLGGKTKKEKLLRKRQEVVEWRVKVFERDNYTCQECGARSQKGNKVVLNADHIKPWAIYPELRTELSNGRTLCEPCHRKTKTYGRNAIFY